MNYEIQGSIKVIFPTQTFKNDFTKREVVVTTEADKYPQDLKFEFVKDKCPPLDNFKIGQRVKVSFDIRGSEYNGKYYVNLSAWKIASADGNDGMDQSGPDDEYSQAPATRGGSNKGKQPTGQQPTPPADFNYDDEDIPF
jgi:single-strand DNA-binding protein